MRWKFTVAAITAGCFTGALAGRRALAAPPDACKLLFEAQINSVIGIKVGEAEPSNNKSCKWEAPAPAGKARPGVSLALQSPSRPSADAAKPARHVTKTPTEGFHGGTYYMMMPEVGGVKVPKDCSILQIRVYGFPTDQSKTKEKILGDCVLETLTNGRFQGGCPI